MENIKWIRAMSDRLRDTLSSEYDDETKDLIIRAFMRGLYQDPAIVEELKSSSLIESDYFEDANEEIN
jgi:hypothetical protein